MPFTVYYEAIGGCLNPVYTVEGNLVLIFFTAQLVLLLSQPQHQLVNCR